MMSLEELREAYVGKMVRTEDATRHNCGRLKSEGFEGCPDCGSEDLFGGEGLVVAFHQNADLIWMEVDWGFSWVVGEETIFQEVSR